MTQSAERILLINPKDSYVLGSPPLGVGYLMAYSNYVGKNEVFFHDENFIEAQDLDGELDRAIRECEPTFVGISFPSSAIKRVLDIAVRAKRLRPEALVFAGGYHPTSEPEDTLRLLPMLDFAILDQAEHAVAHLGQDWRQLKSAAYIDESGEYIENEICNPIDGLDSIPYVDRRIYDQRYYQPNIVISGVYGRTATLMSSRGCPYRCAFCSNELLQKRVAFHSVDYVLGEIESLRSQVGKIDYLYFLDVMFLTKWQRTRELCEALIRSKVLKGVKWAATVAANVTTYEKVKLMKEAGCFYLSFGLESNSLSSLQLMNKVAKPHHNEQAMEACKKAGILANSAFLFGIPGETEADLRCTLDFVKKYDVFSTGVNVMKPLPGSPYYYQFIRDGRIEKSIDDWHSISSIHHYSGYFNDRIDEHTYERYREEFNRIIYRRARRDYYRVNLKNIVKYKLLGAA